MHAPPARTVRLLAAAAALLLVVVAVAYLAGWPAGPRARETGGGGGDTPSGATPDGVLGSAPAQDVSPSTSARPSTGPTRRPGGKPGRANTGVPPGTRLTMVTGDQTYSRDNQVITGLDIRGYVRIQGRNVTIRNSILRGGAGRRCNSAVVYILDGASATIEDSEIAPSHPNPCLDGIWAQNAKLVRLNIHGAVDGVKAHDNVTLQDSWLHDMSWFASDPNQGGGPTHNDAVQTWEGNRHIVLRHNTMSPGPRGNAAYQVTQDGGQVSTDLRIERNWLDGGGCTLNFAHKGGPTPMTGISVVGNRFGRGSTFQCPILVSTRTILSANSGNVWDDTGRPIPPPQRHD